MSRSDSPRRARALASAGAAALLALTIGATSVRAADPPWLCLPPIIEGGARLHPLPVPRTYWLPLLLRQHQLCWAPRDSVRMVLLGNSAVYGLPLQADETMSADINRHFDEVGLRARLYNLGFVTSYQVKDAVILREALRYAPQVIVYPLTLADFEHFAPFPHKLLVEFFTKNADAMSELYADPPGGLAEPFASYQRAHQRLGVKWNPLIGLREAGMLLRTAAHANADWFRRQVHSSAPLFHPWPKKKNRSNYNCEMTEETNEVDFENWKDWNVLVELQRLHEERGIDVVVVQWPVSHSPRDMCYNPRYTQAMVDDFSRWITAETSARNLPFVDLRDLLPPDLFADSIHVTAEGHRHIAQALEPILDSLARAVAARTAAAKH